MWEFSGGLHNHLFSFNQMQVDSVTAIRLLMIDKMDPLNDLLIKWMSGRTATDGKPGKANAGETFQTRAKCPRMPAKCYQPGRTPSKPGKGAFRSGQVLFRHGMRPYRSGNSALRCRWKPPAPVNYRFAAVGCCSPE